MKVRLVTYINLFIISAVVLCFEIISTRISSVIFVNNYAFIIISLAILGLGSGGIYAYFKFNSNHSEDYQIHFSNIFFIFALSILVFIIFIARFKVINPIVYFIILFIPFFIAGIFFAKIFKLYAESGFTIYAIDLSGAATGSILSILLINLSGGINSIILLIVIILFSAWIFRLDNIKRLKSIIIFFICITAIVLIFLNGNKNIIGKIPIGKYPEKDFYHVYENPNIKSHIIDSRWSIYGRTDLVEHSHQDLVKHIFIDGAAGSPMYRFNGNPQKLSPILYNMLIRYSNTLPFLLLNDYEKNSMLIIGPGGGREVLTGLLAGVEEITGVEINPDFVNIVKDYSDYNGGIYTDFLSVNIYVQEGRHYIKNTDRKFDIINIALPSTEQLQNIDNFAMSENFLLTVEALHDYLNILTPEGRIIFTLHNNWELHRLIISIIYAFEKIGIEKVDALNHFIIIENDMAPTIVIKKQKFSETQIIQSKNIVTQLPDNLPQISYFPFQEKKLKNTEINNFILKLKSNDILLNRYIENYKYDISPCYDDRPYFYKVMRGIPDNFIWLIFSVLFINLLLLFIPFYVMNKTENKEKKRILLINLMIFCCIGIGFIIIEISLFQKLILYLGSPTVSLSILLCSLLIGMGLGSYLGKKILSDNTINKISLTCLVILLYGTVIYLLIPQILDILLAYGIIYRGVVSVLSIIPLGFFLGIPFPTAIKILDKEDLKKYIPWMYGINGTMTVLGSVFAVIISMISGFTMALFIGLSFYFVILIVTIFYKSKMKIL